jgi:purine-binding chemotaxis protein CheW
MRKGDEEKMRIRAERISFCEEETKSSDEFILVVEFLLTPEKYAIDCSYVTEVLSFQDITPLPNAPNFIIGLVNIRGRIISIVNLMRFLNQKETGDSLQNKILVIQHDQMEFGITADEIIGTKRLDMNSLGTPSGTFQGSVAGYIHGVSPDGVILLNATSILSDKKIIINQK